VCWEPGSIQGKTAGLFLVSADTQGHIIVWDVQQGKSTGVIQDGTKPILGIEDLNLSKYWHNIVFN
jgi:hypothetical protein